MEALAARANICGGRRAMWTRNWGWVTARGAVALLFGLIALLMPAVTWLALVSLFVAFTLVDGLTSLVVALSRREPVERPWALLLLEGVTGIAVAVFMVIWPIRTSVAFIYLVGAWGVVTGLLEVGAAFHLRRVIAHEWLLALAGMISIVFGAVALTWPVAGILTLVWWIGAYAVAFGLLLIALGLRLRRSFVRHDGGNDFAARHEVGQTA
jgi:uncharacterized membrane protein HdeD (DUF308 family)